ncbi:hypothetical protein GPJ56_001068 [Histomonas meleagridis]|uniref:uncharacterized protein n=1 Tax=Histomonas meleagridis TaxID=135588 RepID=UPI003559B382|nr:hypothetical protein GPJ56_001068 [Histomonas meleagridis]KAH0804857.1 hypothetical protein GO595_002371 [Histomonas meleagridis]
MKLKLAKSLPWENTTSLVDMIAGLPEVISLRILTENTTYSLKSNSISGHLPMPKQFPLNPFYEGYDKPSTTHLFYDGLSDGFYQNLAISNQMRPIKAISRILESVYSNLTLLNSKENTLYVPVVDSISISIKDGIKVDQKLDAYKKLYGELKKSYRSPEFSIFTKAGSSNDIYVPFRFESSFIRTMIRENDISSEELINMFRKSLEICKVNDGFAGRLKINSGRVTSTNIQHSNFFGQWSSLAALIALGKENLIRKSVFNERGHILYSDMIIENNDDE